MVRAGLTALMCVAVWLRAGESRGYPLEDFKRTGIARLEGYYHSLRTLSGQANIPSGARLKSGQIGLRLAYRSYPLPAANPDLSRRLTLALGGRPGDYGAALLDITDPARPRYAAVNAERPFMLASAGKVLVALALLQSLADVYPNDTAQRERILREAPVVADDFIISDTHEVPFWHLKEGAIEFRPLRVGDAAGLWTYLDWMLSASSNAAASMVMKELMLLDHFRERYPVGDAERAAFFNQPPTRLAAQLRGLMRSALERNGLNPGVMMQGSFFTKEGKRRVPGAGSMATPQEMLRFLLRLEEGRLVDRFSSEELKRLLYLTQRRVRYAAAPVLDDAALYFKSGSHFRCRPEAHFVCGNYQGNAVNLMNALAIVESPAGAPRLAYMVVVTSNVLRRDSNQVHAEIAERIHRLVENLHPRQVDKDGGVPEKAEVDR
jgi:hypothetical protein